MPISIILAVLIALSIIAYAMGRRRSTTLAGGAARSLHSRPGYYGLYVAIWCAIPSILLAITWTLFSGLVIDWIVVGGLPDDLQALPDNELGLVLNTIHNLADNANAAGADDPVILGAADRYNSLNQTSSYIILALALALAGLGLAYAQRRIKPHMRARNAVENTIRILLIVCSTIAILTTVGIVLSLLFESVRFFSQVPVWDFLFGLDWSPQTAIREDQVGSSGSFGAVPLFTGTLLISGIAMLVAVPIGLFSAIYLSEYAGRRVRGWVKPALEVLAGVPTVVYGFFAAITVAPFFREIGISVEDLINGALSPILLDGWRADFVDEKLAPILDMVNDAARREELRDQLIAYVLELARTTAPTQFDYTFSSALLDGDANLRDVLGNTWRDAYLAPRFVEISIASESALAAGVVMGVMIIPFVSSLSDDVINAVPQSLRDGAYALGATRSETIKQVIIPAALPGIVAGILLAVSRAIGETMIVVMAAGLAANLTANPFEAVTTVTVQIVTLLTGDQEFDSPKTLAAFALGLVLFVVTLAMNIVALRVVRKYREKYD